MEIEIKLEDETKKIFKDMTKALEGIESHIEDLSTNLTDVGCIKELFECIKILPSGASSLQITVK